MDLQATQPVIQISSAPVAAGKDSAMPSEAAAQPGMSPQPPAADPPAPGVEDAQLAIAELVQRFLQSSTRNLEFHVEQDSGTPVLVVRDADGQVIRQIPGEEALRLMRRLNAQSGTLVDSIA